jgi:hypothetical protein
MADITSIVAALNGIKTATDMANNIRQAGLSLEKAEQKAKMAELVSTLADVKTAMADVRVMLVEKDEKIRELESKLRLKADVRFQKFAYWTTGDTKDGPFCQQCLDSTDKLIRLTDLGDGYWHCKTCKSNYEDGRPRATGHSGGNWDPEY